MYYHVEVETTIFTGKFPKEMALHEYDLEDKEDLVQEILIPYLEGKEFMLNGYRISRACILRIEIKVSKGKIAEYPKQWSFSKEHEALHDKEYSSNITRDILREIEDKMDLKKIDNKKSIQWDMDKVFIVHGHDNSMKTDVSNVIRALGFEPIILHEQASSGATIIEKIENYSNVGFGIILYSPCDVGKKDLDSEPLNPRARQNVVFEHGYLIGKLSRRRVCALVKAQIEKPNDISGVVYITYNSNDWKIELMRELAGAGYQVNTNKLIDA